MKPFARIKLSSAALRRGILVSSLALAVVTFFGGCDRWQLSVEARKQAARDGLTTRKTFLSAALPESERSADITNVRTKSRLTGGSTGKMLVLLVGDSPYGEISLGKYRTTKRLEQCFSPGYRGERVEVSEFPYRTILPFLLLGIAIVAYREIREIMQKGESK